MRKLGGRVRHGQGRKSRNLDPGFFEWFLNIGQGTFFHGFVFFKSRTPILMRKTKIGHVYPMTDYQNVQFGPDADTFLKLLFVMTN